MLPHLAEAVSSRSGCDCVLSLTQLCDVVPLSFQIFLAETKVAETREKQKEFEKSSSELVEKLKKITEKREKLEAGAKETSAEMDKVSSNCERRKAAQKLKKQKSTFKNLITLYTFSKIFFIKLRSTPSQKCGL